MTKRLRFDMTERRRGRRRRQKPIGSYYVKEEQQEVYQEIQPQCIQNRVAKTALDDRRLTPLQNQPPRTQTSRHLNKMPRKCVFTKNLAFSFQKYKTELNKYAK